MDGKGDKIPKYMMYHYGPHMEEFVEWTTVYMGVEKGKVSIITIKIFY